MPPVFQVEVHKKLSADKLITRALMDVYDIAFHMVSLVNMFGKA